MSVAVVVNHKMSTGKDGKVSAKPLTNAEMTQIGNLVKEAMGYRQDRGDTLNVVNASFSVVTEEIPVVPMWKDPATISLAKDVAKNLRIAGILFFFVFKVLRPLLKELSTPPPLPAIQQEGVEGAEGSAITPAMGYEERLRSVKDMAKQEPKVVAAVVKDWMGGNE